MKKSTLLLLLILFVTGTVPAQIINTIAGSGSHTGYTCDGCPATSTELFDPGLAIDRFVKLIRQE